MKTIEISSETPHEFDKFNSINREMLFPYEKNLVFCNGFLGYLVKAWNNHYGVKVYPDDIWHVILSELTLEIGKNPKVSEKLFTTVPDKKQEIIVSTGDVTKIDPELVIEKLKHLVPLDIERFLPNFSTSTIRTKLARSVCFCDMVSPYYSYGTMLCNIPVVRIEGSIQDWELIYLNLRILSGYFDKKIATYLERCAKTVNEMISYSLGLNHQDFFGKMVKLEKCGSGSQYEMSGWILNFIFGDTRKKQLEGLPPHTAKMEYKNQETKREFTMFAGLLYCYPDERYLISDYNAYIVERKSSPP